MERIEVQAHWDKEKSPFPERFSWQEITYIVEGIGRRWKDEHGLHILCLVNGGKVFELVYQGGRGWSLRRHSQETSYA